MTEVRWANDRAVRICFGDTASEEAQALVLACVRAVEGSGLAGLRDIHPAYSSVLVVVDPVVAVPESVEARLRELAEGLAVEARPAPREVEIPVAYGGDHGPDLDDVARLVGLDASEVVRRHAEAEYRVAFLGFAPGFAYLNGLPEDLRVPRLPVPRRRVPAGSLGIGGGQTGVYPLATPGGWRLIGRTPLELFRADRRPPALMTVGDRVRFVPIGAGGFARMPREQAT